jgi:hypothetical protein
MMPISPEGVGRGFGGGRMGTGDGEGEGYAHGYGYDSGIAIGRGFGSWGGSPGIRTAFGGDDYFVRVLQYYITQPHENSR